MTNTIHHDVCRDDESVSTSSEFSQRFDFTDENQRRNPLSSVYSAFGKTFRGWIRSPMPPPANAGGKIEESLQTYSGPATSTSESSSTSHLPPYTPRSGTSLHSDSGSRNGVSSITSEPSPIFELEVIRLATENFNPENKLGAGRFGAVYEGVLPNGKKVAVKRLSQKTQQGYCVHEEERLLIIEYLQNTSLDNYIFDPEKKSSLNWETRYKIIKGIAQGLVYLHRNSRSRILHRDLKAGNILLDENMVAKIADFGTARMFTVNQPQANRTYFAETSGHMAWEYLKDSEITEKSDVFSFGILLLEIISGQDVNGYTTDLTSNAYNLWEAGTSIQLMDPVLKGSSTSEVGRCIHIGLLCVQHEPNARPDMLEVVIMLESNIELNNPFKPTTLLL